MFHHSGAFVANTVVLVLVTLIAQSWGLLFGGSFMDPKLAQTVTTVVSDFVVVAL